MKKVLAFALSLGIIGAVAAQPKRSDNTFQNKKDDRYEAPKKQDRGWDNKPNTTVYNTKDKGYDSRRMSDRERQQEMDRINRDYDRRVAEYRNDRRLSARDRDYKIQTVEKERNDKLKTFGGGLLLGGLLGAILSH